MKFLAFLFLVSYALLLVAQPNPELRRALRDHYIQNMYPVLKPQHEILEKKWTKTEAEFLANKRSEFQAWKLKKRQWQSQVRQARQSAKTEVEIKTTFANARQQLRQERQQLWESMRAFVEQHQAKIVPTNENLLSFRNKWQQERKAIRQQYKARERKNKADTNTLEFRRTVRFLLWNGKNPHSRK